MSGSKHGGSNESLAVVVASLAETVARQGEALRVLAEQVAAMQDMMPEDDEAEPTTYLSGKPIEPARSKVDAVPLG